MKTLKMFFYILELNVKLDKESQIMYVWQMFGAKRCLSFAGSFSRGILFLATPVWKHVLPFSGSAFLHG